MPKKLEIIVGDEKLVGDKIAKRVLRDGGLKDDHGRNYIMACAKGSSVLEFYRALKKRQETLSFLGMCAFCIDEDLGTSTTYDFLKENLPRDLWIEAISAKFYYGNALVDNTLFDQIRKENPTKFGQQARRIISSADLQPGIQTVCLEYEAALLNRFNFNEQGLTNYPIDMAIMGLGVEPLHVGSNFPPADKDSRIHLAEKIDKDGNVVGYALTMGIGTLCSAEEGVLFAYGEKKAEGVKEVLEGPITENCPPSLLLSGMDSLTVALDQASASRISYTKLAEIYQDRELVITEILDKDCVAVFFDSKITDREAFCRKEPS